MCKFSQINGDFEWKNLSENLTKPKKGKKKTQINAIRNARGEILVDNTEILRNRSGLYACNLTFRRRLRQEDHEFKATLSYTENLQSTQATHGNLVLQTKQAKEKIQENRNDYDNRMLIGFSQPLKSE